MYTKRVPFLPKMVYKRVTQWLDLGAELPCIKLCCGGAGIYKCTCTRTPLEIYPAEQVAKYCKEILCRGKNVMSLKVCILNILAFIWLGDLRSQISGCYQGQSLIFSNNTRVFVRVSVFDFHTIHSLIQWLLMLQSVTIRRAISKNHKASLISELCHDVSQKYTKAAGEVDVSLILLRAPWQAAH